MSTGSPRPNRSMGWRAIVLLLATSLQLCAAEEPPHIARGHLLAAFCGASPDKKPEHVTAIYRGGKGSKGVGPHNRQWMGIGR